MKPPVAIQPVMQVGADDCAIAALAMYLNVPYRGVSDAVRKRYPKARREGMSPAQMIRLAQKDFGQTLTWYDEHDQPYGIVVLDDDAAGMRHYAVRFTEDVLIDPSDGQVWDYDAMLVAKIWTPGGMLA